MYGLGIANVRTADLNVRPNRSPEIGLLASMDSLGVLNSRSERTIKSGAWARVRGTMTALADVARSDRVAFVAWDGKPL
jgi:hypothetical protein